MSDFKLGTINFSNLRKEKENSTSKGFDYLSPLCCDTVSFGALKKSQFKGIDLLVVNKFKAPIDKFNTNEDLQNWCKEKVEDITKKDYKGRQQGAVIQRKSILKEWFDYVQKENDAYNSAISLLILDGITKDLKPDEDSLPPVLNKGILADTISQIQEKAKNNPKSDVNFSKMYQINLQKSMLSVTGDKKVENITGWIVIPSEENDPEHFRENVEKVKLLSHHNWCTKSFNAEPYLSKGDFHVYLENGEPKLGIRFVGDKIQDIQGEMNDSKIPDKYFDIVAEHVKDEKLSWKLSIKINLGKIKKWKINKIKKQLKNASPEEIFNAVGIRTKKDKDGLLIISEYHQPYENLEFGEYTFADLDIDENKLMENVKIIEGLANFGDSKIEKLKNVRYIGSHAWFKGSNITSLGNLECIGDGAIFGSVITDLGNLKKIKGNADFSDANITSLGKLQTIGGYADFSKSQITDLGNLKEIKGAVDFRDTNITSLGKLQSIGGYADFRKSQITDLGNLKEIKGAADFRDTNITSLGNLQTIGGYADFSKSQIINLGNLQTIGGNAYFGGSKVTDLGKLQTIDGDAYFGGSKVTDLGKLLTIGGNADFRDSKVANLGKLQTIGDYADFRKSQITNLGNLQTVGKKCYVNSPQTELIEKLKEKGLKIEIR